MNAFKDHIFAIELAFRKLAQGKFWLYILPSVVVAVIFYSIFFFFDSVTESASAADNIPWIGKYITMGVATTMGFFTWITNQFYMFFILTLLSPVSCMLSEKVDNDVTGAKFDGGILRIMTDLLRAFLLLIFTMMLNFLVMGAWALITWIIGFHALDFIAYFLISAFFLGFSLYDYSLERYGTGFFGTVEFGFSQIGHMVLTGGLFSLIYALPVVGLLLAPFLATIISTIVYVKMNGKIPNKQITNSIQQ